MTINKMPKLKRILRTFLQIWLFYYFVNAIKVHECAQINDVEFINPLKNEELQDTSKEVFSDKEIVYEPMEPINHEFNHFDDIDDQKHVNLNVNNNLPEVETHEIPSKFTEISESVVTGEMTLRLSESPFLLRQDLEVSKGAKLSVDPGVMVYFAPMVGITVHGQVKAIVSIVFHVFYFSYLILCCYLMSEQVSTCKKFLSYFFTVIKSS